MTLTNIDNAGLSKALIGYCYPKELVTFSVVHSGNVKKVTNYFEYIDRIELLGASPTKKASLAAVTTANDWYHDRDAGIIYYYTTSVSLSVVVRFGFFFKTGDTEVFKTSLTTGELVYYHGRMKETSFNQSIDDISSGVLGVYSTNINFINNDSYYNYLARDNVSFVGSDIIIHLFINDITNNAVVFRGTVESAAYASDDFQLSVKDSLKVLSKESKFTEINSEFEVTAGTYPNANSNDLGYKIPYLLGRKVSSELKTDQAVVKYSRIYNDPVTSNLIVEASDKKKINTNGDNERTKLLKIDKGAYNFTIPATDGTNGYLDPAFYGNIAIGGNVYQVRGSQYLSVRIDNAIKTYSKLVLDRSKVSGDYVYSFYDDEFYYGEFSIDLTSSGTNAIDYYEGQLLSIYPFLDSVTPWSETYGKAIGTFRIYKIDVDNNKLYCTHGHRTDFLKAAQIGGVWQKYHVYFSDISVYWQESNGNAYVLPAIIQNEYVSQSNSRRLYKLKVLRFCDKYNGSNVTVENELKRFAMFTYQYYFDGSNYIENLNDKTTELDDKDFYVTFMQENTNMSVGNAIHKVLRYAGIETDGGTGFTVTENPCSFKDIDTTLGTTYYSLSSQDGKTYLELLEKMLSSVFGFIYLKNNGKYGVRLFENVPYDSNLWAISEDNIIDGSIDSAFDCSEIATRLLSYGPNGENFRFETKDDNQIQLHGDISNQSQNFLENQTIYKTKVFNRKYSYYSKPTKRFNFTIINNGYEIVLGDRISVDFAISKKWLGEAKTYELFVISVTKSLRGVDIVAIENKFPSL